MSPRRELKKNLANSEWMRQRVLPRLTGNSFGKIYGRIFHATDDSGSDTHWDDNKEPFEEKGLKLGRLHPGQDTYDQFPGFPFWFVTSEETVEPGVEVYVLESGRLAFVQVKRGSYDSGKSLSAYGEYGNYEERRMLIPDVYLLRPHARTLAQMILENLN